ncbi:hypothetical protein D3P09_16575 [Paenibacillus pinisoli]|uniref:WxL domain-containing protein n=1 Tax=Paenibacillus pinisoli TaxID=1276110 RepID=A0A3A6PIY2_9BACL|nr:WxL domain-containing protein [Paenibacillus pinisoli]RJX39108.1 hypothetical protein D3P09_16575 [Paenibacillus pinisoli]
MLKQTIRMVLVFSLLMAAIAPGTTYATGNLLNNGGFEVHASGNTADHWTFRTEGAPDSYIAELSTASVSEGAYAQRLSQDGTTVPGQTLRVVNKIDSGFTAGDSFQLTFQTNITSLAEAKLRAKVEYYKADSTYLGRSLREITNATSDYSAYEVTALVPADTDLMVVAFEVVINANGGYYNLFIDDVQLQRLVSVGDTTQVGIIGGDLKLNTVSGSFMDVQLNHQTTMTTTMTTTANITDNRGNGEGWAVKISATDFFSQDLADPSSAGKASLVLKLPVSNLQLETSSVNLVSGQPVDATYGPAASSFTASNFSQTVVRAQPGFGMGSYNVPIRYTLLVPKTLEIISLTGTDSKFKVGDYVGTREGYYTATLNFTIGTGL